VSGSSTFWRRLVIYLHRWLGIAGSLLFISWFASGLVLMYAGMPDLTPEERLLGAPGLDLATATVGASEAAVQAGFTPSRILFGMHGDRPAVRRLLLRPAPPTSAASAARALRRLRGHLALLRPVPWRHRT
jgi:hypothetical protein